jgi:hypothetical protein
MAGRLPTWSLILLALLLGVAASLAATNPTLTEYETFLNTVLQQAISQTAPAEKQMLRQLIDTNGRQIIRSLVHSHTRRHNYGVFSTFDSDIRGITFHATGAVDRIIPQDDEETLRRKIGQILFR